MRKLPCSFDLQADIAPYLRRRPVLFADCPYSRRDTAGLTVSMRVANSALSEPLACSRLSELPAAPSAPDPSRCRGLSGNDPEIASARPGPPRHRMSPTSSSHG